MGTVRYTVVDGEVLAEKRNGVRSLYVPDPLGSTVALLNSAQTQTDTFSYWPYGETRVRTGTTPTPFQFVGTSGYYQDSDSMTYVRARSLNIQQARWQTQDPSGYAGGMNLYVYAQNNPATMRYPQDLHTIIQKIKIDLRSVNIGQVGKCVKNAVKNPINAFGPACSKAIKDCIKDPTSWIQVCKECFEFVEDPPAFTGCVLKKMATDCLQDCLKESGKELIFITYNCIRTQKPRWPKLPPPDKWPKWPPIFKLLKPPPKSDWPKIPGLGSIACNNIPGNSEG